MTDTIPNGSMNSTLVPVSGTAPTFMHEMVMARMRTIFRDEMNRHNPIFATVVGGAGQEVYVVPDGEQSPWRIPFLAGQRFAAGQRVVVVPTQAGVSAGTPVVIGIVPRSSFDYAVIGTESIIPGSITASLIAAGQINGMHIAGRAVGGQHIALGVVGMTHFDGSVAGKFSTYDSSVANINDRLGQRSDSQQQNTAFGRAADALSTANNARGIAEAQRGRIDGLNADGGPIKSAQSSANHALGRAEAAHTRLDNLALNNPDLKAPNPDKKKKKKKR